ncbi:MAG: 3,4-dihydroxy-2-butanone-4-phosphate synthase [Flavobacteriia bacterium]|nr:3,4-dihydroxy-2-butanone-4-phosphate synthase [Flavobacteriia bacterium]
MKVQFDTIPDAIAAIKRGEVIIVVDDENRENEGDFIAAAESITPELVNFMATHGRGLICTPLTEKRCQELDLAPMVSNNTDPMETAFTVSVDLKGNGVTTGISAQDRCKTIQALTQKETNPYQLSRPGHIFPLIAKEGGVLRRTGHTDSLIVKKSDATIATRFGEFRLRAYQQTTNGQVHLALSLGDWQPDEPVLTRINSTRIHNDILGLLTGGTDYNLEKIFDLIKKEGKGAVLFINQQQASENLLARIEELKHLQEEGNLTSSPPMRMDIRDFGIGAQILHDLQISKLKVISNSTQLPRIGLTGYGIEIESHIRF